MTGVLLPLQLRCVQGSIHCSQTQPLIPSDGESEVGGSDADLPMPKRLLPKVWQAYDIEHMLDKGAWATMPATRQGGEIFIDVSL